MQLAIATVLLMASAAMAAPLSAHGQVPSATVAAPLSPHGQVSSATVETPVAGHRPPLSAHGHVPSSSCVDMRPIHGNAQPSEKPSPYTITVTPTSVNGGDTVRVHVSGMFRGLYMQARRGEEPVGEFLLPSGETNTLALSDCGDGHHNAVSYISHTPIDGLDIDWKAPNIDAGIVFRATFVKTFSEFWVGVESPKITVGTATTTDNAVAA